MKRNHHICFPLMLLLMLVVISLFFSCEKPRAEFFVSPEGHDQNPGSAAKPFASIERARDAIRAYKDQQEALPEDGFKIYLREGNYPLTSSFRLEAKDSGTDAGPVVYSAYRNEKVSIHGGHSLPSSAFEAVSNPEILARLPKVAHTHVKQIDLRSAGITAFGNIELAGMGFPEVIPPPELFFNGEAMRLARWPNDVYAKIAGVKDAGTNPRSYQPDIPPSSPEYVPPEERDDPWRGFVIQYEEDRPKRWSQAEDIWLFGYWYWDWADGIVQVAKIDTVKKEITSVQPSWYSVRKDQRFYAFNLLEEIDSPGEWYLDRKSGILYFYPPASLENATIQLSILEDPLVVMNSTQNIRIEKLIFEVSRGHGIHMIGGKNNLIAGCTLRRLGQKAVVIGNEEFVDIDDPIDGGKHNGVLSCDIYDTGKGGVVINGGERRTLETGGNYAENNHIHHYSRIRKTYSEAVQLYGVGNRAAHNLIHDAPHAAIEFRGNDHLIEYNEIHHVNQEADDAGAIYTGRDWTYRGNMIRYNFMHHMGGIGGHVGVFGIYLDDAMSSANAYGNVFYKVWRAFHIGGGRDHSIRNNMIVNGTESIKYDDRAYRRDPWFAGTMDRESGTLFVRLHKMPYQTETWKSEYPKLVNILEGDPGIPSGSVIENNVIFRTKPMELADIVQQQSIVQQNLMLGPEQDPGFSDTSALDFSLTKDAIIYDRLPGFKEIPFEKIGLYEDEYRKLSNDSLTLVTP